MTGRAARTALPALISVLALATAAACNANRPTAAARPRSSAAVGSTTAAGQSSGSAVSTPDPTAATPNPSASTPTAAATATTSTKPAQTHTTSAPTPRTSPSIAPLATVSPKPEFLVSVTSAPTAVSVPSNGAEWDICLPITLHITNDTGATVTTVTVNPAIESRSPGGQVDDLQTNAAFYTVLHPSIGNGHTADIATKACGYIYNNAAQTIVYVGTAQMVGGYATPAASQLLPGSANGLVAAIAVA